LRVSPHGLVVVDGVLGVARATRVLRLRLTSCGILSAYLPTETAWQRKAPSWAVDLWPVLKAELELWCLNNKAQLHVDETAAVYTT
jgi:hypothetical protein